MSLAISLFAAICLVNPGAVRAEPNIIKGSATAVDGDTLKIGGERVRLLGIDAPEQHQTCSAGPGNGKPWPCGSKSTQQLQLAVSGLHVTCEYESRDRYNRPVAVCIADGRDINEYMIRTGHAVATPQYSTRYVEAEELAKVERRGIWAGKFQMPSEYRQQRQR